MDITPQKLADWLQDKTIYLWDVGDEQYYASPICEDIVPMLRQQATELGCYKIELELHKAMIQDRQAEIEALAKELQHYKNVYEGDYPFNAEPVAWISKNDLMNICHKHPSVSRDKILDDDIPLYTHPADLTDEEYEKIMQQWDYWRKQIADGDKSSAPRDWFECVIENLLEQY